MRLSELLPQLGAALGLPELSDHAQGACALRIQGLAVTLAPRPDQEAFVLRAPLGRLPADVPESWVDRLLAVPLGEAGHSAGALVPGIDALGQVFLVQHVPHAGLSLPLMLQRLDAFVALGLQLSAGLAVPAPASALAGPVPMHAEEALRFVVA